MGSSELQGTGLGVRRTGFQTCRLILSKALKSPCAFASPPVKWVMYQEMLTSLKTYEGPRLRKGQKPLRRAELSPVGCSGGEVF